MLSTTYTGLTTGETMPRVRIREIAEAKGLDVAKLSRRADLAYGTVWQLWNDPERDVSIKTLGKLAEALGVPLTSLIEDDPAPEPEAA
jgi:transcriptional regulator with XRE-family HTH domain